MLPIMNNIISIYMPPDDLSADTALVLVNAVYFKGNWADKFNPNETKPRPFHVDATTTKDVPTMHRFGKYRYGELPELKAKFVELPYKVCFYLPTDFSYPLIIRLNDKNYY